MSSTKASHEASQTVDAFLAQRVNSGSINPHKGSAVRFALRATAEKLAAGSTEPAAILSGLQEYQRRQGHEVPRAFQPLPTELCNFIKVKRRAA